MHSDSPASLPQNSDKKIAKFLSILFLIILFLGLANYFKILPVSNLFPKYLGFLPQANSPFRNSPKSQQRPLSAGDLAQQLFSVFASRTLKPSIVMPSNIYPVIPSAFEQNSFDYTWTIKNSTMSAHLKLSSDYKNVSYLGLSIVLAPSDTIPSMKSSSEIVGQFLSISPQGAWQCKSVGEYTSCKIFWQDQNNIKKGIDLAGPVMFTNNQKGVSIYLCEIHKDDPLYESTSCSR